MSVIRPRPPEDPLAHESRLAEAAIATHADRLAAIRDRLVAAPPGVDLAARVLDEYDTRRPESRLFAILAAARRIREAVDRLVVVAGGGIAPATRLLVATCCHPFHDQLARGERGGRPRLSWLDGAAGNDELQGLLDLVTPARGASDDLLDRWAIVPIDVPPDDPRQAAILDVLRAALAEGVAHDRCRVAARVVPVAAAGSRLTRIASFLGCDATFADLAEIGGPLGPFTAAGLLPAAVAGIDVVRILKGAGAMLQRFAEAPVAENPALVDAAVAWQAAAAGGRPGRAFVGPGRWPADLAAWHGELRPVPAGSPALVTTIMPGEPRRDRLAAPAGDPMWPELSVEAAAASRPQSDVVIRLPRLDEHAIGQLLQLLVLSAAVEERLRHGV